MAKKQKEKKNTDVATVTNSTRKAGSDSPADPSFAYGAMSPDWKICRDVSIGQRAIRDAGEEYLPKNPSEEPAAWQARKKRTPFFNAFDKTVNGLSGMAFRKDPIMQESTNKMLEEHLDNLDLTGKNWRKLAQDLFKEGLEVGHYGILIDMPLVGTAKTLEDERVMNIRPYWITVTAENIISWRTENVNGKVELAQVVLLFHVEEPSGDFGMVVRREYRVFRRNDWQVWRHIIKTDGKEDDNEVALEGEGTHTLGRVPFIFGNLNPTTNAFRSRPPLLGLAHENIGHYQLRADYINALHYASIAVLAIIGAEEVQGGTGDDGDGDAKKTVVWGSDSVLKIPLGGDAKFVEHSGKAIGAARDELSNIEERMSRVGLAMLAAQNPETKATKIRFDKSESDSQLVKMIRQLQKDMNDAWEIHKLWLSLKDDKSFMEFITEFTPNPLTAEEIKVLSGMVSSSQLSLETMWENLKKGEVLEADFDAEEERERIAKDGLTLGDPDDDNPDNDDEDNPNEDEEE